MAKVINSSIYISIGFIASRMIGLIRDLIVSAKWGANEQSDLILLIVNMPDLITNVLVGSTIISLLVPKFVKTEHSNHQEIYSKSITIMFGYGLIGSIVLSLAADPFIRTVAPGFSIAAREKAAELLHWIAVSMVLIFLTSTPRAYLQAKEKFNVSSFENIFYNIPIVVGLLLVISETRIGLLGPLVLLASVLRLGYLLWGAYREGARFKRIRLRVNFRTIGRFASLNFTSACTIILFFVLRAVATNLGPGQLSIFSYFYKILEVPFGLFTTIIFSILLSRLSANTQKNGSFLLLKILVFSLSTSTVMFLLFALTRGQDFSFFKVTSQDVDQLLLLLSIGVWSLPARLISSYLQAYEYSAESSRIALVANVTALIASLVMLWLLQEDLQMFHLAWVTNLFYYVTALTQIVLNRRLVFKVGFH